jgi:hypothetical protein
MAFAPAAGAATKDVTQEWPNTPSVTCDRIVIDPPTWIKVTFTGTINGTPFTRSAFYGGDGSHDAHISIADLTDSLGRTTIVVTATSNFLGTSHTARVTIDCPSTGGQDVVDPAGAGAGGGGSESGANAAGAAGAAGAESSGGGLLPFTGSEALRLALIGLTALAIGVGASLVRARRRQIGRASRDIHHDDEIA